MVIEYGIWLTVDVAGTFALVTAGFLSLVVARTRGLPGQLYWLGAAFGLAYLAFDERFSLHERIGRRLYAAGVPGPPGINHMDDAVLLAVGLVGVLFTVIFVREVVASRPFAGLLGAAAAFTAAGLAVDSFAPVEGWAPRVEEILELGGQLILLSAFGLRAVQAGWLPLWDRLAPSPAEALAAPATREV